jgi:hypothetical protein
MKNHANGIIVLVPTYLAALSMAMAAPVPRSQDESGKLYRTDAKKTEEKKTGKVQPLITVHIKVSAEGVNPLPSRSSIQLKGLDDCDTLARDGTLESNGQITFSDLPVCKVMLKILITGFEHKTVTEVDLADRKHSTMRIEIKSTGPPILN